MHSTAAFLPTPSHGGRRSYDALALYLADFYPRPHMEGDIVIPTSSIRCKQFLPTPSHGGRHELHSWKRAGAKFLPTPSHGGRHRLLRRLRGARGFLPTPSHGGRLFSSASSASLRVNFYPRPHMEGDSKHAEVQACISAAYLKCSTRKAAASRRCADLGGRAVLFHQLSRLVLGRARCEPRGEGMCDRGSHRQSGRRKGLKTHSSKMSSWLH